MTLKKVWDFRVNRFIAVGITNTAVDFLILNFLVFAFGLNKIVANSISVSIALLVSYTLNHHFVFRYKGKDYAKRLILFLAITTFGLFIIQNLVIYILVNPFTLPADIAITIINGIGIHNFSDEFITLNFAKAAASGVTMVWNYIMYKNFVFKEETKE
jgi:putative flippase GtrA